MPPCSPLSSTSPRGRAICACLTGAACGRGACAWAGTKERPPQRPDKGTGSRRRMTLRQPLSYRDPNTEPLHENGGSPVLSLIYANTYFPTYTNELKEIATHLQFKWSILGATGLNSIIWRAQWE